MVYIADRAARFGSTDADEFTLQQQKVKTKEATKYAVEVLSDFMLEKNYDGLSGHNGYFCTQWHFTRLLVLREWQSQQRRLFF